MPWGDLGMDIVLESTGFYASAEKSQAHLDAGAKCVLISAPVKALGAQNAIPNFNGCC